MLARLFLLLWLFLLPGAGVAETCRLALVLALDVSGSVNEIEYRQQLDGLAYALDSAEVREVILDGGGGVRLSAFEWSSRNHQFLIQPWIRLETQTDIDSAVSRIRSFQKRRAGLKTALSTALLFASELLRDQTDCWQYTIDVSGDGENNIGPEISHIYGLSEFSRITVNALVVGDPASDREIPTDAALSKSELLRYYEREIIRGPGAFAMIANGYGDYARAMQKKLLREMRLPTISSRNP